MRRQRHGAGGGYELALATDHIMLVDDRRSAVSLPETPLLAVLPGTGGLTRLTDKRKVRRDRADVFCSIEEGIRGAKAVEWRLVDEVVPNSKWKESVAARAHELAERSDRPARAKGIALTPLQRKIGDDRSTYSHVDVEIDRERGLATITVRRRRSPCRLGRDRACARGGVLAARDRARAGRRRSCICASTNRTIGVILFRTEGDAQSRARARRAAPERTTATG